MFDIFEFLISIENKWILGKFKLLNVMLWINKGDWIVNNFYLNRV